MGAGCLSTLHFRFTRYWLPFQLEIVNIRRKDTSLSGSTSCFVVWFQADNPDRKPIDQNFEHTWKYSVHVCLSECEFILKNHEFLQVWLDRKNVQFLLSNQTWKTKFCPKLQDNVKETFNKLTQVFGDPFFMTKKSKTFCMTEILLGMNSVIINWSIHDLKKYNRNEDILFICLTVYQLFMGHLIPKFVSFIIIPTYIVFHCIALLFVCNNLFHVFIWYKVFLSNTNNLHTSISIPIYLIFKLMTWTINVNVKGTIIPDQKEPRSNVN